MQNCCEKLQHNIIYFMPKISVLMSAYNHAKFIKESIDSVLNQTYQDFELLIIDDNSTDSTFEIIKSFNNHKIKAVKNQQNVGMVLNTNRLISMATGEYIAIINSDDSWHRQKLEKQLQFLEQNRQLAGCFTLPNLIDEESKIIHPKEQSFIYHDRTREGFLADFFHNQQHHFCYPSVLLKKEVFNQVGFFNASLVVLLDFDMWVRILIHGFHLKMLPEKLTNFRYLNNEGNLSAGEKGIIRFCLEIKQVLLNYTKISNHSDFIKIFPNYSSSSNIKLDLPSYFYLLDYCWQNYFDLSKSNINNSHIKNFILEFIQFKNFSDSEFYMSLQQNINLNFSNYLTMTSQYPNAILINKIELLMKKIKKLKNIRKKYLQAIVLLITLLIMILFYFL